MCHDQHTASFVYSVFRDQSIVYKLSPEMFIESLDSRPKAVLTLLADDYKSYDQTATVGNIDEKLADYSRGGWACSKNGT